MIKAGILGGSFNPVHNGHIELAKAAMAEFKLDKLYIIPTGISHFKEDIEMLPGKDRLNLCRLAFKNIEAECLDIEIKRPGVTYSCDTVKELKELKPDEDFYFICGSDCLDSLHHWRNAEYLFKNVTFLIATRAGEKREELEEKVNQLKTLSCKIELFDFPNIPISSTEVRERCKNNESLDGLMPNECIQRLNDIAAFRNDIDIFAFSEYGLDKYFQDDYYKDYVDKLRASLSRFRYVHSLGVAFTAGRLAMHFSLDTDKAFLAGLLHDCAKEYMRYEDNLAHGPMGKVVARKEYGIEDEEVLGAIAYHVVGAPNMTPLQKIVFVADYIEPGRKKAKNLEYLRDLAGKDIDLSFIAVMEHTFLYLHESGMDISKDSKETYNFYTGKTVEELCQKNC